jgi:transposase
MMGPQQNRDAKLFYVNVNLEERLDAADPLRQIAAHVDFTFIRQEVRGRYGVRGNPSLDPTLVLKLLFLLFYENVPSERELMRRLPCRLDWLWFLSLDLDSAIPDHSVLSKARRRWGPEVFAVFFQRVLGQCLRAGLVDGSRVHVDGSLIAAHADKDKLTLALQLAGESLYGQLEAAGETVVPAGIPIVAPIVAPVVAPVVAPIVAPVVAPIVAPEVVPIVAPEVVPEVTSTVVPPPASAPVPAAPQPAPAASSPSPGEAACPPAPGTLYCPTDPEARLTRKYGQSVLGYKDHRVVDDRYGIITATLTTAASVAESSMLAAALEAHETNTGLTVLQPTADKGYGTADNYELLRQHHCTPCIPHPQVREDKTKFARALFIYDPQTDTHTCPAGQTLTRRGAPQDGRHRYQAPPGVCAACPLREQCTAGVKRVLSRQVRQDAIDWADTCLTPWQRRIRMRRRKIRAEGSFADAANHHGYKRARWRGRRRVTIQNLLIATTQNLRKLVRWGAHPTRRPAAGLSAKGITLKSALLLRPSVHRQPSCGGFRSPGRLGTGFFAPCTHLRPTMPLNTFDWKLIRLR